MHDTSTSIDVTELTIATLQSGYALKRFTCVEITRAFLDRIKCHNSHYNAIIFLNTTDALEQAEHIDSLRSSGQTLGPLTGVPVVVKVV